MTIYKLPITWGFPRQPAPEPAEAQVRPSACVGCIHNVGDKIRECTHYAASQMTEHFTFVDTCAWRETEEPPE
jgi:hypothetical protein